jgi:hypothetical protein
MPLANSLVKKNTETLLGMEHIIIIITIIIFFFFFFIIIKLAVNYDGKI